MTHSDYDARRAKLIARISRKAISGKYDENRIESIEKANDRMTAADFTAYVEDTGDPVAQWVLMQRMHQNRYCYRSRVIGRMLEDIGEDAGHVGIDVHMASEAFADDATERKAVNTNVPDGLLPTYDGMFALSADLACPKHFQGKGRLKAKARMDRLHGFMDALPKSNLLGCFDRITIGSLECFRKPVDDRFVFIDLAGDMD